MFLVCFRHKSTVREKSMGLFDSITSQITGAFSAPNAAGGADWMGVIGNLIHNPQTGGLQGLIQSFQDKGLGGVVSSWVGTGENLPISAEQLTSVLGQNHLQEMAQKVGLPVDGLAEKLSGLLPQVVDQLTPNGEMPQAGSLQAQGMDMLGGLLK
jgi:uncharacterized protein YidB (DUF937 family)